MEADAVSDNDSSGGGNSNLHVLDGRASDAELAAAYRTKLSAALEPVLVLMTDAGKNGLSITWNISRDGFGKLRIQQIDVVRPL